MLTNDHRVERPISTQLSIQTKSTIYWIAWSGYALGFLYNIFITIILFKFTLTHDSLNQTLTIIGLAINLFITVFNGIVIYGIYLMKEWARIMGVILSASIIIAPFLHITLIAFFPLSAYLIISGGILLSLKNFE